MKINAEILSFSNARKKTAKLKKKQRAEENRIKFGHTKTEKNLQKTKKVIDQNELDDNQIDR